MGDHGTEFWHYYKKELPLNVMVVGKSEHDEPNYVYRPTSQILALEYIVEGKCTFTIRDQTFEASCGDVVLLPKHFRHKYGDSLFALQKYWIVFDGPFMEQLLQLYLPGGVYLYKNCNLQNHFEKIFELMEEFEPDYESFVDKVAQILFDAVLQMKKVSDSHTLSLADRVRIYLDSRIEQRVTLDQLCIDMNYSKNHIIRIFKEEYGITPYQYLTRRKIDVAKLYLKNTDASINEISAKLAFADQHYFSNCFHQEVGCSPIQYRKQQI